MKQLSGVSYIRPPMTQWGELFDGFVDAALYTGDEAVSREEILGCLNAGTLVPGRYMYSSDLGAKNWIRLCGDSMYRHHRETVEFWANSAGNEIATLVLDTLGRDDLDYISLGPGDGEKDAELINHWLDHSATTDVFYYPYDISRLLIAKAVETVCDSAPKRSTDRLRIKAVLADFNHLKAVSQVFKHRESPNVVALLGSLGNLGDERKFLQRLKSQMTKEDLLILEVRLRPDDDEDHELMELKDGDAALRFDFGAIESFLGLKFSRDLMTIRREANVSSISETLTTVVGCQNLSYYEHKYPEARLMYIHQYNEGTFIKALEKSGFKVLTSMRRGKSENFLVCLAQRKR